MRSDYGAAEQFYRNALGIFSTIGDKYSQGTTLHALAEIYRSLGAQENAASLARQAREYLASFPALVAECDDLLRKLAVVK